MPLTKEEAYCMMDDLFPRVQIIFVSQTLTNYIQESVTICIKTALHNSLKRLRLQYIL